jgi:septal ring-binding cell division protein DamX
MPTTDCATDIALPDLPSEHPEIDDARRALETSKPLKGLFFGFAVTVTIGLALASWYVGVRIVSADEITTTTSAAPAVATATPATPPAVSAETNSIAEAYWYTVPPAEFYLQAGTLGPKQDAAFIASLNAKGFRARMEAPGSGGARIVIGPFSTHTELELAQRKLEASGVLAVEAAH